MEIHTFLPIVIHPVLQGTAGSLVLLPMPSMYCFPWLHSPFLPSLDISFSLSFSSAPFLCLTSSPASLVSVLCQPQEGRPMSSGKVGLCLPEALQPSPRAKSWHSHNPLIPQPLQLDRGYSLLKSQQPGSDKFPPHSWEITSFFGLIICLKYIFQWCQEMHFGCKQPNLLPALLQKMVVQSFNWMTILLILTWKGAWVFLPHTVFGCGWTFQNV